MQPAILVYDDDSFELTYIDANKKYEKRLPGRVVLIKTINSDGEYLEINISEELKEPVKEKERTSYVIQIRNNTVSKRRAKFIRRPAYNNRSNVQE